MTDEVVESRPGGWGLVLLFLVPTVAMAAIAAANGQREWAVAALIPLGMAAGAWLGRDVPVRFTISEIGLHFEPDGPDVLYADIQGLTAAAKPTRASFQMQLYHPGGAILIPAKLTVPSRDLYAHLVSHLPANGDRNVPAALRGFRDEQEEKFGPDRVFTFRARLHPPRNTSRRAVAVLLGTAAGGLMTLLVTFAVNANAGLGVMGVFTAFFAGFIGLIVYLAGRRSRPTNWAESGLVIGPMGLALAQGPLKGKMRWDEIKAIEHPPKSRAGTHQTSASRSGIGILVPGAYIVIADYYDRPAILIYERLRGYWEGDR